MGKIIIFLILVIGMVLIGLPSVNTRSTEKWSAKVEEDFIKISKAIETYRIKYLKYPKTMHELTEDDESISQYMADPFGYPYIIDIQTYKLRCSGPDGKLKTEDDIELKFLKD